MGEKSDTLAQSILLRSTYCLFLIPDLHKKCHQHIVQVSETALTSGTAPKSDCSWFNVETKSEPSTKTLSKTKISLQG